MALREKIKAAQSESREAYAEGREDGYRSVYHGGTFYAVDGAEVWVAGSKPRQEFLHRNLDLAAWHRREGSRLFARGHIKRAADYR